MMKSLLSILAVPLAVFLTGLGPAPAVAADAKAKPVAKKKVVAKKKAKVVAKRATPRRAVAQRASGKRVARAKVAPAARSIATASLDDATTLGVKSSAVFVQDQTTGAVLYEKNAEAVLPIASITKLMTAMVALDARPDLQEILTITDDDVDTIKGTTSRLRVGTRLSREEMLRLALMSSENRAASALSRHYPGGREAFVAAMNRKARAMGLHDTRFEESTGLSAANVSSPRDLARMVDAAYQYPLIREFSTSSDDQVVVAGRTQQFRNTNSLVNSPSWEIGLSKTGYISEAGKCLVMQAWINNKPTIIVLLDSWGKMTRIGDANRIKRWVESASLARASAG